jgi:hypothetical protein
MLLDLPLPPLKVEAAALAPPPPPPLNGDVMADAAAPLLP